MKIKILQPADTGHEMICKEYLGTEVKSLDDIFEKLIELENEFTNHTILATLDDLGQAQYTSMHATMCHGLDETEDHNLSKVDSYFFEDGEYNDCVFKTSEFLIREANFLSNVTSVDFTDVCGEGLTIDNDEMSILEKIHTTPIDFLDSEIIFKVAPVQSSPLALIAFPNGYFYSHLNPFQNYALAKHLEENYGYELFGLGASLIGFKRNNALDSNLTVKLAEDLAKIYNRENEKSVVDRFVNITNNYNYLFLKYTESLEF